MKAVEIRGTFGGPEALAFDPSYPEPGQPGPGQVLVRVRATSLNYRDLMIVRGVYNPKQTLPLVPLSDGAGEVTVVGEGVTSVVPGDRVAGTFVQDWTAGEFQQVYWSRSTLGSPLPGMLREYALLPERGVVKFPEHLSFEEAATLPCAAVTAWNALVTQGGIKAGDTVLVQGTGGVSLFALQFAKMHGARVIATSSSDEKLARAGELGADEGINYKKVPDWDSPARELTGGLGVDHVVEVGGAGTLERSLRAVRAGGTVSLIGVLTAGADGVGKIDPMPILFKAATVRGILVGSREMFEQMNRGIAQARMRPVVDRVFSIEEARAAYEHLAGAGHFGKIVIRID
jgi:NADPH:quinone reductase-like Zn-dependent oxidoreductase